MENQKKSKLISNPAIPEAQAGVWSVVRRRRSILNAPDGIHVVVENADNEDAVFAGRFVENQVAFMGEAAVSGSYFLCSTDHFRIVTEKFQAAGQRVEVVFCLQQANLGQGLLQDIFDILGCGIGKPIHRVRAVF